MAVPAVPPVASALWTVRDLVGFFARTPYPVPRSELQRWIARHKVPAVRCGRADHYDLSAVLVVHRDEVRARLQRRSSGG